jgi:hypothetical protein
MRAAGGNHATLRKYAETIWCIPTDHFDRYATQRRCVPQAPIPLEQVLVRDCSYSRRSLKLRLIREGLLSPACELCGQGEVWHGRAMSLILDHINGIADDNRLQNLRLVCPNCAATLDTHCGKHNRMGPVQCAGCGRQFRPPSARQRYCGHACYSAHARGRAKPEQRRVPRPPYNHLVREVRSIGYLATGRRYGVSDTAIRKWIRQYQRERARGDASEAA